VTERDEPRDPLVLDLGAFSPTTEAGRQGLRNAIKGNKKGRNRMGTHPWDEDEDGPKDEKIPEPPKRELDLVPGRERAGISDRARAAANLKVDNYTYQEIAEILEYPDARAAKREVERVLALTHSMDEYETLRLIAAARAEARLKLSTQMAAASFLVVTNEDGVETKVVNDRQLSWHTAAGVDLMNWATIVGAKSPTKVEITPDVEAMEMLVDRIAAAAGFEDVVEADVLELEVIPEPPTGEEDPDADA